MPELPEVETVKRVLASSLKGVTIESLEIRYSPIIENEDEEFIEALTNNTIVDIHRYGKYLIFVFERGYMLSHLRMEGKYFYVKKNTLDNKHIHVIFHLDNGFDLLYQDVRKFGRMHYIDYDPLKSIEISKMGPDLILNENIDISELFKTIKNKHIPIKQILLDQSIVAGLGNIYVDEVLYNAKINPKRYGSTLRKKDVENIILCSKEILSHAIELKGTTIRSYTSSLGVEGGFQDFLQVHTKTICPNCKKDLIRVKIDSRMTYYCKTCQR